MNTPGKIINGYEWGAEIGKGAWGKVRRVKHLATGEECAVKIIYRASISRKIKNGIQLLYNEVDLVQSLNQQNIIKYRELDDSSNPDKFYLFMELCQGDIQSKAPSDPKKRTEYFRSTIRQLLEGLVYLQSQNISHHDIKTENILITSDEMVKICDFGVAERYDPSIGCTVFFGTPAFHAPEIAGNVNGDPFDGHKADVWSAGVVLYQLITGELPFTGDSVYLLMKSIDKDPVKIPNLNDKNLQKLLTSLLKKNPAERPTASEALQYPWFSGIDEASVGCCRIS